MSDKEEETKDETSNEEETKAKKPRDFDDEEDEKDDETRAAEEKAAREAAKKRCYKYSDPPKIYTDVNPDVALKDLQQLVSSHISEQEIVYMAELQEYIF